MCVQLGRVCSACTAPLPFQVACSPSKQSLPQAQGVPCHSWLTAVPAPRMAPLGQRGLPLFPTHSFPPLLSLPFFPLAARTGTQVSFIHDKCSATKPRPQAQSLCLKTAWVLLFLEGWSLLSQVCSHPPVYPTMRSVPLTAQERPTSFWCSGPFTCRYLFLSTNSPGKCLTYFWLLFYPNTLVLQCSINIWTFSLFL